MNKLEGEIFVLKVAIIYLMSQHFRGSENFWGKILPLKIKINV